MKHWQLDAPRASMRAPYPTAFGREKSPVLTMKRDMKRVYHQQRRKTKRDWNPHVDVEA